ncbi:sirohydrochlorin cobaltochelatase [Sporomusa acidovorans]|uniref:Sirohydrochlorin cobaltochelatase n=1 Tax=Sporomusa acidovorans (strain ATCC 49682 / DSM 3132 / Mol) TaxID=1123286 RepID=A0ABZ3IY44_SPOA4|nr:sirohydrochlorin cobaltochelatase [Sporomusa acidovorans]OZC17676.1 sirohydrochlorin cobaltochelatase [Sporomusa acidovorans DSM 3132]SDE11747.1 sirohydrochlorin cobaltochelatase [Sporomusa acidovorans]
MEEKWKRIIIGSMACVAFIGANVATTYAAYQLNPEVKNATPALKRAAEIGVRVSENAGMKDLANKDAIVVMSFGTTYADSRRVTIEKTVADIQAAHPDTKVVLAFTSHIIVDRIQQKEGIKIPTPEEALAQLKAEGYTRIALTTLDIIPGMEYAYDSAIFDLYKHQFKKMTMGTSLMYWMGQENQADDVTEALQAIKTEFPRIGKRDAVLLMDHGTPHPANAYYSVMQARLQEMGMNNVFIYTVEGWPGLETVIPQLKAKGIKNVTLIPMMMVAGDHANNDMAGSDPESHKSILEKAGFHVSAYIHGLGENENVRKLFVERANDAWNALEAETVQPAVHHMMK